MRKLHGKVWSKDCLNNIRDKQFQEKAQVSKWIEPKHIGIDLRAVNMSFWRVSASILRQIEDGRSPKARQRSLDVALESISIAYTLCFPGREAEKLAD